jgi:chromosomal replication initiation ATPase DnaA
MWRTAELERVGRRVYAAKRSGRALLRDRRAARIIDLVAAAHAVTPAEVLSRRRCSTEVAVARQLSMYLVHTLLGRNYQEVGVLFGRDRTTVSHACARTEDRREDKSPFEVDVTAIESILREEANCG